LKPGQPDYRILVVEDREENWLLLDRLLQPVGFQVRLAEDGAQAVEAFKTWRPHFIWMDLGLPVISGLEAARRIREIEGGRDVTIVAVTASAFASQREEVMAAGMDDFLRKPYRPREIFDCMARHLGVRYVYGPAPQALAREPSAILRPEDLAALSEELRKELENAVISLDVKRIAALIRQVSEQDPALGGALASLAERFAYTSILNTLEKCGKDYIRAGV
jgi:CheY-like chemotaxis protein